MLLIAVSLGISIGLALALTGAGGGILAVPALTLGLGLSMTDASPVALLTVAVAASIGMIGGFIKGWVRIRAALLISATGILIAPAGQYLSHLLPERWLAGLFACVMLIVAARIFRGAGNQTTVTRSKTCVINTRTGRIDWNLLSFIKLSVIGLVSGLATGLLGVGGGFIVVPALIRCSDISMNGIIATSLTVIALISGGAVISAASTGHLLLSTPVLYFVAGAAIAMSAGRLFAGSVSGASLQKGFAVLLSIVAALMLFRALY